MENESTLTIRRAKVDSLCIYEITEDELQSLEQGNPSSLYLTFWIALLTAAIAFFITLVTVQIKDLRLYDFFLFTTIICFILGIIFLILWMKEFRSIKSTVKKIRDRLRTEDSYSRVKDLVTDPTSTLGNTPEKIIEEVLDARKDKAIK